MTGSDLASHAAPFRVSVSATRGGGTAWPILEIFATPDVDRSHAARTRTCDAGQNPRRQEAPEAGRHPAAGQRLRAGESAAALAISYGLGKGTVLDILRKHGVRMRGHGLAEDQLQEAAQLYLSGWSLKRVGAHFVCSADTIRVTLNRAGVPLRAPWERGMQRLPTCRGGRHRGSARARFTATPAR
jgi:hypothetical protein